MHRIPWPAISLLFIAPFVGEVMSTSTSIFVFANPWGLLINVPLYGGGALLVREAVHRWQLGLPGFVALGGAYGFFEEAGLVRSWFATDYQPDQSGFSRIWDTNLLQLVHLTTFHIAVSIGCSILIVELLYPAWRNRNWAGRPGLAVAAGAMLLLLPLTLEDDAGFYAPHWPQMLMAFAAAAVLVCVARLLPRGWPAGTGDRSVRRLALLVGAALTADFLVAYIGPYFGIPWPVVVLLALAVPIGAVLGIRRVLPARRESQQLGIVIGLLVPLALLNAALLQPATLVAAAVAVVGLVVLHRRTVRRLHS